MSLHLDSLPRASGAMTRRRALALGGRSAAAMVVGMAAPALLQSRVAASTRAGVAPTSTLPGFGKAKSAIVLWLLGGISQVESWDPKPNAPQEVRGEFGVIDTNVPGIHLGELLPKTSRCVDRLSLLRAVVTGDNGHSSSGYHMLTGVPHIPPGQDNLEAKFPNFAPSQAAMVRRLRPDVAGLPSAIVLPYHIRTDAGTPWPGQGGGDMGKRYNPWLLDCDPAQAGFRVDELTMAEGVSLDRLASRRRLLASLQGSASIRPPAAQPFESMNEQAFDLLNAARSQRAFKIDDEPAKVRDRYGRTRFGQSTLLARRLVEAGVSLVQVNWTRVEGQPQEGAWDTHGEHCLCAKSFLMPMFDQTFSALIEDLHDRGQLAETLVVALSEFGRTPRFNNNAGRDHWGTCFSLAMAGGGVRGGFVFGESDRQAAWPVAGAVSPADLLATIFHALGLPPDTVAYEHFGRDIPLSSGRVIHELF